MLNVDAKGARQYSAGFFGFVLVLAHAGGSRAGGPIGTNGTPIQTSAYAIDLHQGPVFAGTRVTGLSGAYVAIAEDVDGNLQNPAAPAVRPFFSYTHFDYWLGFGVTFPATLTGVDFFNSGGKTNITNSPESFVFFVPAVNVQWGELGVGLTVELQHYELSRAPGNDTGGATIGATIPTVHLQFAHGIAHNQWVVGVGGRYVGLSVDNPNRGRASFGSRGTGLEFGAVYKPEGYPLRVGVAWRTGIRTEASYNDALLPDQNGDLVIHDQAGNPFFLPKAVALPWDVNFGFALQFGRSFNPRWRGSAELVERETLSHRLRQLDRDAAREEALRQTTSAAERKRIEQAFEREQDEDDAALNREWLAARRRVERRLAGLNRRYLQVAASMLVSGSVDQAIGIESFVAQTVNRSGQQAVYSTRFGLESEVVPELLKVRTGSYLEPTRFQTSSARVHGTLGVDVRLLGWNVFGLWPNDYVWRLGLAADAARDYFAWGLTIGGWYPRQRGPS